MIDLSSPAKYIHKITETVEPEGSSMPGRTNKTGTGLPVIILCGGQGTRMGADADAIPKPMTRIGSKPILWHIMKHYCFYGHHDFVLTLGHLGDQIKQYFANYEILNNDFTVELGNRTEFSIHEHHAEQGWNVTLADTGPHTLKGGRIKRVEQYVDHDRFMLTYGDGVADIELNALIDFHRRHGKIGTVTGVFPPSRFGELFTDGDRVVEFSEKPQVTSGLINGGYFIFERRIFDYLSTAEDCDFEFGPLQQLAQEGELMVYTHTGFWACMDTLRDRKHLERMWESGEAPWKLW